jgi:hypothetical protein
VGWLKEEFEALNSPGFEVRGAVTDSAAVWSRVSSVRQEAGEERWNAGECMLSMGGPHGGGGPHGTLRRLERGLAMGGGHPAERRFTVGGSGKSVARCHRTMLAYWKFESISLQRRVFCELGSRLSRVPRTEIGRNPASSSGESREKRVGGRVGGSIACADSRRHPHHRILSD